MKTIEERIKEINPEAEYIPKEAAWYLGMSDQSIRRACRKGRIKARNTCLEGQNYFVIKGSEIIRFYESRVAEHI